MLFRFKSIPSPLIRVSGDLAFFFWSRKEDTLHMEISLINVNVFCKRVTFTWCPVSSLLKNKWPAQDDSYPKIYILRWQILLPFSVKFQLRKIPWKIWWQVFLFTIEEFAGGSDSKESICSVGDPGSILGAVGSPGEGNGNPLQYSCLENSMDRGAWPATVHQAVKSRTQLNDLTLFTALKN